MKEYLASFGLPFGSEIITNSFPMLILPPKRICPHLKKHLSILVIMQENIVKAVGCLASLIWCCVKSWTRPPPTSIFKGHPSQMPFIPVETPVLCYNLVSVCYYLYLWTTSERQRERKIWDGITKRVISFLGRNIHFWIGWFYPVW